MNRSILCTVFSVSLLLALSTTSFGQAQPQETSEASHGEFETLDQPVVFSSDSGIYKGLNETPVWLRRSAPFARGAYELVRLAGPSGTFDPAAREAAFHQAQQDQIKASERAVAFKGTGHALANSGTWSNIGINAAAPNISCAGITTAIAVDPSNTNVVYAAGSGGGVFKSLDAGGTWTAMTDNVIPNLAVASMAIDPVNTQTLYIGTGYGYNPDPRGYSGTGIYKTTDGGSSWQHLTVPGANGTFIKVIVDPLNDNVVLASNYDNGGLYRSTNGGTNWTRVSTIAGGIVWDIAVGPANGSQSGFYAVEGGNVSGFGASTSDGVYSSTDDGATWTKFTSGVLPTGNSIFRSSIASSLHHPEHVFVLMTNSSGSVLGYFYSSDAGVDWATDNVPSTLCQPDPNNPAQGWYDLYIGVTPYSADIDTVFVGGVEAYANYGNGQGWQLFSGYESDLPPTNPHVDHHSIAFDPKNPTTVYEGNDGGLYKNTKAGDVNSWSYSSAGMVSNRVYHIALDPTNATWAGLQDQGNWRLQAGHSSVMYFGGDGFQPLVNPTNPQVVYVELPSAEVLSSTNYKSAGFSVVSQRDNGAGWDAPLALSPTVRGSTPAGSIIYLGKAGLYQSIDAGQTWKQVGPAFGGNYVTAIGLAAYNPDLIYSGWNAGKLEVSTNFGASWTARSGLPNVTVSSIRTTGADTNLVLVSLLSTTTPRVMLSHDRGQTWTNVSGNGGSALPASPVSSVAIDSASPLTTWYAATDVGLYYTTDAGNSWNMSAGLGLYPCRDVELYKNKTTIRLATFGRGVWESTLPLVPQNGVEFTSLTAQKTTGGTTLAWSTSGEPSAATYFVERSVDGDSYERVGTVAGLGASSGTHEYSYLDTKTTPGTYLFQIHEVDADGTEHYSNHVELHYGVDGLIASQSYPNPFVVTGGHATSHMTFELPSRDAVTIRIFNSAGQVVRTLLNNQTRETGEQIVDWDGRDDSGNLVASGGYFYSIETSKYGSLVNKTAVVRE